VAALAGISTTWYTWIEQGREITVSPEVLAQIGRALNLAPSVIEYMCALSRPVQQREFHVNPIVPEAVRMLVQSYQLAPAYVSTPRFDLLVWNDVLADMFDYDASAHPLSRNTLWRFFFDPSRRQTFVDWERAAGMFVANFRHVYANYREDPQFDALLEELMRSEEFARMWERWDVHSATDNAPFLVRHRTRGICELAQVKATLDVVPDCYLSVYSLTSRS